MAAVIAVIAISALGIKAWISLFQPELSTASAETPARPIDGRLLGQWVSRAGERILVVKSGAVWADSGMIGRAMSITTGASQVLFSGEGLRCNYVISFPRTDETDWLLVDHTRGAACPTGRFNRLFMF